MKLQTVITSQFTRLFDLQQVILSFINGRILNVAVKRTRKMSLFANSGSGGLWSPIVGDMKFSQINQFNQIKFNFVTTTRIHEH